MRRASGHICAPLAAAIALVCGQGVAVADAARPAPDYFVRAVMETTTAQALARACPDISVNPATISVASGRVLEQLQADGFDAETDDLGMQDPSEAIRAYQDAFVRKHDLDGADTARVCATARAEMAEGTAIGSYLIEVRQ